MLFDTANGDPNPNGFSPYGLYLDRLNRGLSFLLFLLSTTTEGDGLGCLGVWTWCDSWLLLSIYAFIDVFSAATATLQALKTARLIDLYNDQLLGSIANPSRLEPSRVWFLLRPI